MRQLVRRAGFASIAAAALIGLGAQPAGAAPGLTGYLDTQAESGGSFYVAGWACNGGNGAEPVRVDVYFTNDRGSFKMGELFADQPKAEAAGACQGNPQRGFSGWVDKCPAGARNGGGVVAYAVSASGAAQLGYSSTFRPGFPVC